MINPLVLCYSEYPTDKFVNSVQYVDPGAYFLQPKSFDGYVMEKFSQIESVNSGEAYICYESNDEAVSFIMDNNMDYQQFGHYYLAIGK